MSKLEIFDPAMCCSTGVCGPSVDPKLTRVASAVFSLQKRGFDIERYNLANEPDKFTENKAVTDFLEEKGPDALPVTLLNGKIVLESTYPSNDELSEWFDISTEELNDRPKNNRVTIQINELK
ncbi:arsenite efflux transporter metallochaperone ArsD [Virgibacillus siamensis]|uniref:arsenite efflux transporter metallochaperone ArsD n=1 Tax=Virgibacillus siamensis TaxID=480071 RepID=UPI000984E13A|nr:arsenite efflux transporter metallochaperone ArsD [Virgibacillus siamensis]